MHSLADTYVPTPSLFSNHISNNSHTNLQHTNHVSLLKEFSDTSSICRNTSNLLNSAKTSITFLPTTTSHRISHNPLQYHQLFLMTTCGSSIAVTPTLLESHMLHFHMHKSFMSLKVSSNNSFLFKVLPSPVSWLWCPLPSHPTSFFCCHYYITWPSCILYSWEHLFFPWTGLEDPGNKGHPWFPCTGLL